MWGRAAAILVSVTLFTAWHLPTRYFHASGVVDTLPAISSFQGISR